METDRTYLEMQFHPTQGTAQLLIREAPHVVTVDLRTTPEGITSEWWVTGPTRMGAMAVLLHLEIGLDIREMTDAEAECQRLWDGTFQDVAFGSACAGGLPNIEGHQDIQKRRELARIHLTEHSSTTTLDRDSLKLTKLTAMQYQLVRALGCKSASQVMAQHEEVPITTIDRRLVMAREAGLLPKQVRQSSPRATQSRQTSSRESKTTNQ